MIKKQVTMHQDTNKGVKMRLPMDIVKLLELKPGQTAIITADEATKTITLQLED